MRFDIITIFPGIFDSYFNESIIKRAREKKLIDIHTHNIRDFAKSAHKNTDDRPYGGGAGMVMMPEPIIRTAMRVIGEAKRRRRKYKIILLSAKGRQYNQRLAYNWSKKFDNLILISGRYEGIDERVKKILNAEEISIGPYILTDGDVAAMAIVSSVARLIPGTIKFESLREESYWSGLLEKESGNDSGQLEYPHFTRPEVFKWKNKKYRVPKILLSGDHKKIAAWRESVKRASPKGREEWRKKHMR